MQKRKQLKANNQLVIMRSNGLNVTKHRACIHSLGHRPRAWTRLCIHPQSVRRIVLLNKSIVPGSTSVSQRGRFQNAFQTRCYTRDRGEACRHESVRVQFKYSTVFGVFYSFVYFMGHSPPCQATDIESNHPPPPPISLPSSQDFSAHYAIHTTTHYTLRTTHYVKVE